MINSFIKQTINAKLNILLNLAKSASLFQIYFNLLKSLFLSIYCFKLSVCSFNHKKINNK